MKRKDDKPNIDFSENNEKKKKIFCLFFWNTLYISTLEKAAYFCFSTPISNSTFQVFY